MGEQAHVTESCRVLVIEASGRAHPALTARLRSDHHDVSTASDITHALAQMATSLPDLVLVDQTIGGDAGSAVLERIQMVDPDVAVVLLRRPLEPDEVPLVLAREMERRRLRRETRVLRQRLGERYRFPGVIGDAPTMQRLFKAMAEVAVAPGNVLITGEAGSGKALLARAIHQRSGRGLLVKFTVDGISEASLLAARGGSLLVDEIAELSPARQAELVRLLERQDAAPVVERPANDVRILAVTGRNLGAEVGEGRFRDDLHERLARMHVRVPALRDRPSDVPALALHFLDRLSIGQGKPPRGFDQEALARLSAHSWPGNVAELAGVVKQVAAATAGPRLTAADLPSGLQRAPVEGGIQIPGWTMDQLERYAILATLKAAEGSTTRTAHILGISVRNVQYKLRAYRRDDEAPELRQHHQGGEKVA